MAGLIKKLFGALVEKPWEKDQVNIDDAHEGSSFSKLSPQVSAVIVIFGVSTVLFSLIVSGYIYTIPSDQDTMFLLQSNLLWFNTFILILVSYLFKKISNDLKFGKLEKIKRNLIQVGGLSYLFLFGQIFFCYHLMSTGKFVSTNSYFSSFYFFTALHGLHLLGGLFFWGSVCSKTLKIEKEKIIEQTKNIEALSLYWTFLLIIWLVFFLIVFVFNDAVIAFCKSLLT